MGKQQTFIKGTEPYRIDEIDAAYREMKKHELEAAQSKANREDARDAVVTLLEEHAADISKNCGERGYVFPFDDDFRCITVKAGEPSLKDTKIKVVDQPADDENEDDGDDE